MGTARHVLWNITTAGGALGALCGALYILLQAIFPLIEHPNAHDLPALLIITCFLAVIGGVSGLVLGMVNGIAVVGITLALAPMTRRPDGGRWLLLTAVGIGAGAVNAVAVRAVLNWWLSGGTASFIAFPLTFGWASAVIVDIRVADRFFSGRAAPGTYEEFGSE